VVLLGIWAMEDGAWVSPARFAISKFIVECRMIGRQIAIGFGLAIIFPLLIFYGVSMFSPPPKAQDYNLVVPFNANATAEERQANAEKQKAAQKAFSDVKSQFASRLFFLSAPLGFLAILIGGLTAVSAVGTG
jgi:hypothetical protein